MGATLLDGVVVEKHAMVAAGALVRQNTRIPSGEVWFMLFLFNPQHETRLAHYPFHSNGEKMLVFSFSTITWVFPFTFGKVFSPTTRFLPLFG